MYFSAFDVLGIKKDFLHRVLDRSNLNLSLCVPKKFILALKVFERSVIWVKAPRLPADVIKILSFFSSNVFYQYIVNF